MFWEVQPDPDVFPNALLAILGIMTDLYPRDHRGMEPRYLVMDYALLQKLRAGWAQRFGGMELVDTGSATTLFGSEIIVACIPTDFTVAGLSFQDSDLEVCYRIEELLETEKRVSVWNGNNDDRIVNHRLRLRGWFQNMGFASFWKPGLSIGHMSKLQNLLLGYRELMSSPEGLRSLADILERSGLLFAASSRTLPTS